MTKPLYAFGYGLSCSIFEHSNIRMSSYTINAGDNLTVEADVRNTSGPVGDAVAELYLEFPSEPGAPPGETQAGMRTKFEITGEFKLPR